MNLKFTVSHWVLAYIMTVILETAAYTAHKQEKLTLSEKTQKTTDQKGQIRSLYRHVYSKYINTEPVLSFGVMCTKKWNVSYEDYMHALNQRYMSWPFKSVCVSRCVLWEKVHRSFINLLSSPHSFSRTQDSLVTRWLILRILPLFSLSAYTANYLHTHKEQWQKTNYL